MCKFRSVVAIWRNECEVTLVFVEGEDSHSKIREAANVRDGVGAASDRQTPLEYIPHKGLLDWDSYEFNFDANRPAWWTEQHTADATRQFQANIAAIVAEWKLAKPKKWGGDLYLNSLTSLPANAKLTAGGYLDLNSLTSLPANAKLAAGGDLYLKSLTSLPANAKLPNCQVWNGKSWEKAEDFIRRLAKWSARGGLKQALYGGREK